MILSLVLEVTSSSDRKEIQISFNISVFLFSSMLCTIYVRLTLWWLSFRSRMVFSMSLYYIIFYYIILIYFCFRNTSFWYYNFSFRNPYKYRDCCPSQSLLLTWYGREFAIYLHKHFLSLSHLKRCHIWRIRG